MCPESIAIMLMFQIQKLQCEEHAYWRSLPISTTDPDSCSPCFAATFLTSFAGLLFNWRPVYSMLNTLSGLWKRLYFSKTDHCFISWTRSSETPSAFLADKLEYWGKHDLSQFSSSKWAWYFQLRRLDFSFRYDQCTTRHFKLLWCCIDFHISRSCRI